jgi:hypothetical protein
VSEWVAVFEALYAARIGKLTNEATELRLAMAPPPFFASTGAKACVGEGVRDVIWFSALPPPAGVIVGRIVSDLLVTKVYAAARNISALAPLMERHGSRIVPLQLDVTNATQIATAAATAADVDLLVNNAGIVGFFAGDFADPKGIEDGHLNAYAIRDLTIRNDYSMCVGRPRCFSRFRA